MMLKTLSSLGLSLIDLIYPRTCVGCGIEIITSMDQVCSKCLHSLEPVPFPICDVCGSPLSGSNHKLSDGLCQGCPPSPIGFNKARFGYSYYDDTMKNLIHAFKFGYIKSLAPTLSSLMLSTYLRHYGNTTIDVIIPVPLHPSRYREREFNQASLLAQSIANHVSVPILEDAVKRKKRSLPQAQLDKKKRRKNIVGAFALNNAESITNKTVLIIDDVYTTGATLSEISSTLRDAKPYRINVLTLARSVSWTLTHLEKSS